MAAPSVTLSDRYPQAVQYAALAHAAQSRKGGTVPYIAHLLGVSSLVLEAGGDEDQAIAALLHDTVEDCGGMPRAAEVRATFGDVVVGIVLACSDSTDEEWKRATPWRVRKRMFLDRLATEDGDVLLVAIADKVHNARAIVTDLQAGGMHEMDKFNATTDDILWYYRENLRIATTRDVPAALLEPLRTAVAQLEEHLS